jgi:hypothetical protein
MPKSRRSKDHKKRVAIRNQKIKAEQTAMQKAFNAIIQEQIEKRKAEQLVDGNITAQVGGQEVPVQIVGEAPQTNQ